MSESDSSKNNTPLWRFGLPLIFQVVLILTIPAQAIYTHLSGKTVILQTVPVDPQDFLRGYYQVLRYKVSRVDELQSLPGWKTVLTPDSNGEETLVEGTQFYVVLQEPALAQTELSPPTTWVPVAVSRDLPSELPDNRISLKGVFKKGWIDYDIERYYMPEARQIEINERIFQTQQQAEREQEIVVEVKVDRQGKAVAVSFWVGDRNYRF